MKFVIAVVLLVIFGIGYNYRSEISDLLETNYVVYATSSTAVLRLSNIKSIDLSFKTSHKGGNNKIFHDALNSYKPSIFLEGINNLDKFGILDDLKSNFHRIGSIETYYSTVLSHINPDEMQEVVDEHVRLDIPFLYAASKKPLTPIKGNSRNISLLRYLKSFNPNARILAYHDPISNIVNAMLDKKVDFKSFFLRKNELYVEELLEDGKLFMTIKSTEISADFPFYRYTKNTPTYIDGFEHRRSVWIRNDFPKDKERELIIELKNSEPPKYDAGMKLLYKLDESVIDYDGLRDKYKEIIDFR
jgi:hypothetical protein